MIFHHIQESHDQFVVINGNDIIHIFLDIREQLLARALDSGAVCDGIDSGKGYYLALAQGFLHTVSAGRLHSDDFDLGIQQLCKGGYAGAKSAAADGNQNVIHRRQLLDDFHGNGTLSRRYIQIVKRMHEGVTVLFCQPVGMGAGLVKYISL